MQQLSILVDNRERNLDIIDSLSQNNVRLSFLQLPVGDYIVSDRMCIERKTVRDFESSIIDNRLFEQAQRLKDGFSKPIVIIEGDLQECNLGRNVILGTILALYTDYNIQVINSTDAVETSYILSKFAEREQIQERREPRLAGSKRAFTQYQWQLSLLSSLPGIGPSLAKGLIAKFKTIKNVANASTDELTEVDKIGKKKAERIYTVINSELNVAEQ